MDDHIAHQQFHPSTSKVLVQNIGELEKCARSFTFNGGMNDNELKMNSSKTEFIMFCSRQMLSKCSTSVINISGDRLNRENITCIRYLDAFFR